eukprot:TRINITY_DN12340_c0_g1_i1.p1 TRINITY_DN12340_c0_g1~~TRINITY_DN12340_c0_g1_i1.p1  ORF type:complete len:727 (-),score=106.51 TRINITY_DN12340_c0_g1_i1:28-2208(-)
MKTPTVFGLLDCPPDEFLFDASRVPLRCFYVLYFVSSIGTCMQFVPFNSAVESGVVSFGAVCVGLLSTILTRHIRLARTINFCALLGVTLVSYRIGLLIENELARQRTAAMNVVIWKVVPGFFSLPHRDCVGFLLWSFILDLGSGYALARLYGDEYTVARGVNSFVWCVIYLIVAFLQLSWLALLYKTKQGLLAEQTAFNGLLSIVCDCHISIDGNGDTVLRSHPWFDAIVGEVMQGRELSGWLNMSEDETCRLQSAMKRAFEEPVLLPISIRPQNQKPQDLELLIVKRDHEMASSFSFLVGIRASDTEQSTLSSKAKTIEDRGVLEKDLLDIDALKPYFNDDGCSSHIDETASVGNSTTVTGQCFETLVGALRSGDKDITKTCLQRISMIGMEQKWLVPLSSVKLDPESVLGTGGFGIVVRGNIFGADVAVKVLSTSGAELEKRLPSLLNEIRVLRGIHHPNVVQFQGACFDPATTELGLIFERVRGIDLDNFICGPPQTPEDTCNRLFLLSDVSCALRYLHAQSPPIVHGDLKSSNVMVESQGWEETHRPRAKLLDFGLSRFATRNASAVGGTPQWIAPEVLRNLKIILKPNTDVFSFGRLLAFFHTGMKPFAGMGRKKLIDHLRRGVHEDSQWGDVVKPLAENSKDLFIRCVSSNPELRPSMEEMHVSILAWISQTNNLEANTEGVSWKEGLRLLRASIAKANEISNAAKTDAHPAPKSILTL